MIEHLGYFLGWTGLLYVVHRAAHTELLPPLKKFHDYHHELVEAEENEGWTWKNLFLSMDGFNGTVEQLMMEIIPTLVFVCVFPESWWILIFYWADIAFISERIEHEPRFRIWALAYGSFHMVHHDDPTKNLGAYHPLWDMIGGTFQKPN